jgi:hypothetical protein
MTGISTSNKLPGISSSVIPDGLETILRVLTNTNERQSRAGIELYSVSGSNSPIL